jgi:predicted methyltransferase
MASTAATIKESVKETLLGVEDEAQLPSQTRAEFMQHAKVDPESGDHYMTEEDFVNAIAPETEDYVRIILLRASIAPPMLTLSSTRSSVHSMPFSSPSPTAARLVA